MSTVKEESESERIESYYNKEYDKRLERIQQEFEGGSGGEFGRREENKY